MGVSDVTTFGNFGRAVSLDGDTVLVGAPGNNSNTGAAYVYVRQNDSWLYQSKLTAESAVGVSDSTSFDYFGRAVSLDDDTVLIGAYGDDGSNQRLESDQLMSIPEMKVTGYFKLS